MIDTTAPASTVSYSIIGSRESGGSLVQRLLGRHRGVGPGRVIHVIRDGRDAAVAAWDGRGDRPLFRKPKKGSVPFSFAASFADHWCSFIEHVREAAQGHGGRYLELRYEALVGDPTGEIIRLLDFLRIVAMPNTVRECMQRVNFSACTVGDWRHRFDAEAAFRFDASAGYLLQELGYAEPTSKGLRRAA